MWALNGSNGRHVWHTATAGQVIGSVVTADLTGGGYQDVIVPTDGRRADLRRQARARSWRRSGQRAGLAFQNSPLVTDDPNGTIGITIAGYNSSNQGVIEHYEVAGSQRGAPSTRPGAWPMFHHDPQLTGDAGTPAPGRRRCPATRRRAAPSATR